MRCLNIIREIKINSIQPSKKETKKSIIIEDNEFSEVIDEQSQIIIYARIENNELIFL